MYTILTVINGKKTASVYTTVNQTRSAITLLLQLQIPFTLTIDDNGKKPA